MSTDSKKPKLKRALVLTADRFEDMELFFPIFRLLEIGVSVKVAAPSEKVIAGENGYSIKPDLTFDQVNPEQFNLLIIPGGAKDGAPRTVSQSAKAIEITTHFMSSNKLVAAICHGLYVLAAANVLKGRKATGYWEDGVPEAIKKAGGQYEDAEVIVDGNLITSRWPMDLPAFMRAIVKTI